MKKEQQITIKNFRKFKNLQIKGFKNINLIGGKNDTGKTSLLEALLLSLYPFPETIAGLKRIRKESSESIRKQPKDAWNSFFYNQQIDNNTIYIDSYFNDNQCELELTVAFSLNSELFKDSDNEDIKQILELISQENSAISILQIRKIFNKKSTHTQNLVAHSRGAFSPDFPNREDIPIISSSTPISSQEIAEKYDRIDYEGKSEEVLKILQILDKSIISAKTYSFIEPTLYLQKEQQKRGLPISLFGDAIYRVTAIILEILNQDHNVLFIDEIENGIHHTSQQKLWEALFHLSEELNTTIFATTHSLEMIKSFAKAGKNFPDKGAYIELADSPRNNDIVAITRSIADLQYEIEHEKPIRGE